MDTLLQIKENLNSYIGKYQHIFLFIAKFITGLIIYGAINSIDHAGAAFYFITNSQFTWIFTMFMGLLFAILPLNANYLFIILNITIQLSSQMELALVVFFGLVSMFLFYGHFGKRENILVVVTVMGFYFNIPYIVPILAGLYFSVTSIVPITIGVFIWSYGRLVNGLIASEEIVSGIALDTIDINIDEIMHAFIYLFESFTLESDAIQTWILVTISMFAVFIFVHIVSRLGANYAKELAIALGTVLNIFSFIFVSIFTQAGFTLMGILFFAILSGLLVYAYSFFDVALNYKQTQRVEFQDEDYYYQVKLIPKRKSLAAQKAASLKNLDDDEEFYTAPQPRPPQPRERRQAEPSPRPSPGRRPTTAARETATTQTRMDGQPRGSRRS